MMLDCVYTRVRSVVFVGGDAHTRSAINIQTPVHVTGVTGSDRKVIASVN
jgi:hypothetical protein